MKVIISHYQNEIFRLREEIQLTQQNLRTITTTSQCDFLLKTLQSFVRKTRNKYTFIKTKKFETDLLNDYRNKYNKSPGIWLRYIDDFLFTWDHDESSLKHFISFCNSYSTNQNMKSKISFEADYSMSHVYFLDTKDKFNAHTLATELYSKPSASFQYLHKTSFHPPHTFCSILKSQFIKIQRICFQ